MTVLAQELRWYYLRYPRYLHYQKLPRIERQRGGSCAMVAGANANLTREHEGDRCALQRTSEDRAQMGSSQSPARCLYQ
jgi:hypothetical protein